MKAINVVSLLLALATAPCAATAAEPDADPALVAIDAAIRSIRQEPNQFNVQLTCAGVQATANGGGTGLSVTVTGGGIGSQTTGMNVSMNDAQCRAAGDNAVNALNEQTIKQLEAIKTLLGASAPDKSAIMSKVADLGKAYIAPALRAVIEVLIKRRLRL
jgi:hypothetical protein